MSSDVTRQPSTIRCPGCDGPAEEINVEGWYGRRVIVDCCTHCRGLWLDGVEALQLSPGGILGLLKVADDPAVERRPAGARLLCPRCGARLEPTDDRQRTTTFHYDRCPQGHGRFMTFFQFLRSRNFVRELTVHELGELRKHIQSVNCSNCGAAVDVTRASVCSYCHTPISTVEPGQIRAAIEELQQKDQRRSQPDPTLPLRLLEERTAAARAFGGPAEGAAWHRLLAERPGRGLVEVALAALLEHLDI